MSRKAQQSLTLARIAALMGPILVVAVLASQDTSAYAGTETIHLTRLVRTTSAPDKPAAGTFEGVVEQIVAQVVRFEPPNFSFFRQRNAAFAFYEAGRLEAIHCGHALSLGLIVNEGVAGNLSIGMCTGEDAKRVSALARAAPIALSTAIETIKRAVHGAQGGFGDPGWKYEKSAGPNGSEVHSFPIVWIGHGLGVIESVVLVSRSGQEAIVVQADVDGMCRGMRTSESALCKGTTEALDEMARQIYARFPEEP